MTKPAVTSAEITLSVRNTLGGERSFTKTVQLDQLHVEIEGADTIFPNKVNVYTASVSNGSSANVEYTWRITNASGTTANSSVQTQTGSNFIIQPGTLSPGTYTINVAASDGSVSSTQQLTITVQ